MKIPTAVCAVSMQTLVWPRLTLKTVGYATGQWADTTTCWPWQQQMQDENKREAKVTYDHHALLCSALPLPYSLHHWISTYITFKVCIKNTNAFVTICIAYDIDISRLMSLSKLLCSFLSVWYHFIGWGGVDVKQPTLHTYVRAFVACR